MNSQQLRKLFLDYFAKKQHHIVASSSLIPGNDPSLLFSNAGMNQFKDVFLGLDKRSYQRAATIQRCVRAGGKHNDLDNVGYTARHHTLFEMLGNFSFGDYFKKEAIAFAWEFLTQELKIPPEKLWVTVFETDKEAEDIWLNTMKIDPNRFSRCGASENFWQMGDTGPCGPCTEIFYDHGPEIAGGPPGSPDSDGDRYIEIWNLVFMQFNRDAEGNLTPLPKPSVDTGMGFERICAVMQNVHNNYDTDLFTYLIKAIAKLGKIKDLKNASLRVVADHIRACTFLIADGVVPSNEGRGYVLRRIIRRAIRHGHKLGFREPFFAKLVPVLVEHMQEAYPYLTSAQPLVERLLLQEEQQFAKTLDQGLKILEQEIKQLKNNVIPGQVAFRLYDTYGFPLDLTNDIARERNLIIDQAGFDHAMAEQRKLSQSASKFTDVAAVKIPEHLKTEFVGYDFMQADAKVLALFDDKHAPQKQLTTEGWVVLDKTPFYVESGGQVSDKGSLQYAGGHFTVQQSRKEGQAILHYGKVTGQPLKLQAQVEAQVSDKDRQNTAYNHSATHLLHAALRKVLGDHAKQKGSLVEPERLRFDYSHFEAPTKAQLQKIEDLVNDSIRANVLVETSVMSPEAAQKQGAEALFGEKYGEKVRVLRMGEFSLELCGGTHVHRTGDIGLFKITLETSISAGVRRLEAVTGAYAFQWCRDNENQLQDVSQLLKGSKENLLEKIQALLDKNKQLEKSLEKFTEQQLLEQGKALIKHVTEHAGVKVLVHLWSGADAKALRTTVEQLKGQWPEAVLVLASVADDKASIVAGVTGKGLKLVPAGGIVQRIVAELGGKGGGRPELAQGGATASEAQLAASLKSLQHWIVAELTAS